LDVKGLAPNPYATMLSAETAQDAIAESINSVAVSDVLGITADGGSSGTSSFTITYDGGDSNDSVTSYLDGQYSDPTPGTYTTQDTFVAPLDRVYENDISRYELVRATIGGSDKWCIRFQDNGLYPVTNRIVFVQQQSNGEYAEDPSVGEYRYVVTDETGAIVSTLSTVTAAVSAAMSEGATTTSLGNLTEGANNRMRCRIRANAMFLRLESSGYPFAIERIAANLQPVGPRRAVIDV